ncbi:MAG: type II toxin-antitoxin system RelE/ParE family toxin [Cyanobacteria bacterium J06639_1]
MYFAFTGRRFVMLHGFQKKQQSTPRKELDIASTRMKSFLDSQHQAAD